MPMISHPSKPLRHLFNPSKPCKLPFQAKDETNIFKLAMKKVPLNISKLTKEASKQKSSNRKSSN